jgi:hypothetical protein
VSLEDEEKIKKAVVSALSPYFNITKEVTGTYLPDGETMRIDYIIVANKQLKEAFPKFTAAPIGLEVKSPADNNDNCKVAICVANQAMVYANTDFIRFGRPVFVLIYPGISKHFARQYISPEFDRGAVHALERVMMKFHCGELLLPMGNDGQRVIEIRCAGGPYWRNTTGMGPAWAFAERRWEGTRGRSIKHSERTA